MNSILSLLSNSNLVHSGSSYFHLQKEEWPAPVAQDPGGMCPTLVSQSQGLSQQWTWAQLG